MGTNYYHRTTLCPTCGREERVHIGKSSFGWTFSFHGTDQIKSWKDWRKILRTGGEIRNEYGDVVTLEEFERLVEQKANEPNNHARIYRGKPPGNRNHWLDPEGHSFSSGPFS